MDTIFEHTIYSMRILEIRQGKYVSFFWPFDVCDDLHPIGIDSTFCGFETIGITTKYIAKMKFPCALAKSGFHNR